MAYITKRGSSYGIRYTYQDEQGKNCNKWESFSTKEEATNRKKQIEHELANGKGRNIPYKWRFKSRNLAQRPKLRFGCLTKRFCGDLR